MGDHESMIDFAPYSYTRTNVISETFSQSGKVFVDNTRDIKSENVVIGEMFCQSGKVFVDNIRDITSEDVDMWVDLQQ